MTTIETTATADALPTAALLDECERTWVAIGVWLQAACRAHEHGGVGKQSPAYALSVAAQKASALGRELHRAADVLDRS